MQTRLLVVDDEAPLAESMADYFDAHGYLVDIAHELEEAQALFNAAAYDVVITDLRLTPTAHEEGLELLAFVRQRWPRTLMVVITAFPTEQSENVARSRGACAVLHKPQPLADIERQVRSLLERCPHRLGDHCASLTTWLGDEAMRERLHSFLLLVQKVRHDLPDAENAAALRELRDRLAQLAADVRPGVVARLTSCLSASAALDRVLRETCRQSASSTLARRLAAEIARLSREA